MAETAPRTTTTLRRVAAAAALAVALALAWEAVENAQRRVAEHHAEQTARLGAAALSEAMLGAQAALASLGPVDPKRPQDCVWRLSELAQTLQPPPLLAALDPSGAVACGSGLVRAPADASERGALPSAGVFGGAAAAAPRLTLRAQAFDGDDRLRTVWLAEYDRDALRGLFNRIGLTALGGAAVIDLRGEFLVFGRDDEDADIARALTAPLERRYLTRTLPDGRAFAVADLLVDAQPMRVAVAVDAPPLNLAWPLAASALLLLAAGGLWGGSRRVAPSTSGALLVPAPNVAAASARAEESGGLFDPSLVVGAARWEGESASAQRVLAAVGEELRQRADGLNELLSRLKDSVVTDRLPVLRAAANAVESLDGRARRLIAFSQRAPLTPRRIDVAAQLTEAAALCAQRFGDALAVRAEGGDEALWAQLDPDGLRAALLELAQNARDATPNGGRLMLRARRLRLAAPGAIGADLAPAGDYVEISCLDDGVGLSGDLAGRAADPLATTKPGASLGLGLAAVSGFARQSGGWFSLAVGPTGGATARLVFPRLTEAGEDAPTPIGLSGAAARFFNEGRGAERGSDAAPLWTPPNLTPSRETWGEGSDRPRGDGPARVLVVEDEPLIRAAVAQTLRDHGYDVRAASDGRAGLRALELGFDPDLLFTDVMMPGDVSASELAQAVRAANPNAKVLYTSGYADERSLRSGFLGDDAEVLAKPYHPEQLLATLSALLGALAP